MLPMVLDRDAYDLATSVNASRPFGKEKSTLSSDLISARRVLFSSRHPTMMTTTSRPGFG